MKKVNSAEMREINGGRVYWCKACEARGYKRKYYSNWFTAWCHSMKYHSANGDWFIRW